LYKNYCKPTKIVCKYESHFENLAYTILLSHCAIKKFNDFAHPKMGKYKKMVKLNAEVLEKCFQISKQGTSDLSNDLVHKLVLGGWGAVAA
jgi:hypothetical protein